MRSHLPVVNTGRAPRTRAHTHEPRHHAVLTRGEQTRFHPAAHRCRALPLPGNPVLKTSRAPHPHERRHRAVPTGGE